MAEQLPTMDERRAARQQSASAAAQKAHAVNRDAEDRGRQRFVEGCEALATPKQREQESSRLSPAVSAAEREEDRLEEYSDEDGQKEYTESEIKKRANRVLDRLHDDVREDFEEWLKSSSIDPLKEPHLDDQVSVWRGTGEYEEKKMERITDHCRCQPNECRCTYDGEGVEPEVTGLNCDYYDESMDVLANYGSRPGDWQPSGGDWDPYENDISPEDYEIYRQMKWCSAPDETEFGLVADYQLQNSGGGRPVAYRRGNTEVCFPAVDTFCTSCQQVRPNERNLSSFETREDGLRYFVHESYCRECKEEIDGGGEGEVYYPPPMKKRASARCMDGPCVGHGDGASK